MKVSIIIPVYNEEKTISRILAKVVLAKLPQGFSKEIIVVNDASTDRTTHEIKKCKIKMILVNQGKNFGKGAAILTGLAKSSGDLILIQDADLEYDPNDYFKLLMPFKDHSVRAVYGSRLINYPLKLFGKHKTPLPVHLIANKFLTILTNFLYASSITDMETCYKVINKKLIISLGLATNRFDFEPEITAKILKRKIKIFEIPIKVTPRSYKDGKKITWRDGLMAIWTLVKYRFVDS